MVLLGLGTGLITLLGMASLTLAVRRRIRRSQVDRLMEIQRELIDAARERQEKLQQLRRDLGK